MKSNNVLPQGEEKKKMVRAMFDSIAPTYEKANTYMTFGLDKYARKILVKELRIPQHSLILDLASGTGDFSRMFTKLGHDTLAVPQKSRFKINLVMNSLSNYLEY